MAATRAGKSGGRARSGASRSGSARAGAAQGRSKQSRSASTSQRTAASDAKDMQDRMPADEMSSHQGSRRGKSRASSSSRSASAASSRSAASRSAADSTTARRSGASKSAAANSGAKARPGRPSAAAKSSTSARSGTAGKARSAGQSGKDAIAFLKQDHRTVESLFKQFEDASDGRTRSSIMRKIAQALSVHAQIEEEIFYPAARQEMGDHDLLNEAQVEHESVKRLIAEIESMRPSEQLYKAKVTVLQEYVKHHVKEEERELFPMVKKTGLDLDAMGEDLAARHQQLMRGGGTARSASRTATGTRGRSTSRRTTAETGLHLR